MPNHRRIGTDSLNIRLHRSVIEKLDQAVGNGYGKRREIVEMLLRRHFKMPPMSAKERR